MNGVRTRRSFRMQLGSSPEKIFPLLCPTREYDWIDTWKCRMIYSDSGHAELDCVFKTDFPSDGPEDAWVVCRYEPPRRIEFVRVNPLRAIRYTICLHEALPGRTEADWSQVVTGLSAEGDAFVRGLDEAAFAQRMREVENMLNHYLSTGRMRRHG